MHFDLDLTCACSPAVVEEGPALPLALPAQEFLSPRQAHA